jgi:hypothetical protein
LKTEKERRAKPRKKNFDLKRDADSHAAHMDGTKVVGSYIDPSAGRISFQEYAEAWRSIQAQHRQSAVDQIESPGSGGTSTPASGTVSSGRSSLPRSRRWSVGWDL